MSPKGLDRVCPRSCGWHRKCWKHGVIVIDLSLVQGQVKVEVEYSGVECLASGTPTKMSRWLLLAGLQFASGWLGRFLGLRGN